MDRELEWEELQVARIVAEYAGERAVGARVGGLPAERAVRSHAAEIRVHGHPPIPHRGLDVRLVHDRVHRVGAVAAFREHDVEQGLHGVTVPHRGDLGDGLSLQVAERVLERARDQHARAAACLVVEALRALGPGLRSRASRESHPPLSAQVGIEASSAVAARVYGYWSAVISSPADRAESILASTRGMRPQLCRPDTLRCEISAGMSASRAMRNTSSSASSIRPPSFRMWDA